VCVRELSDAEHPCASLTAMSAALATASTTEEEETCESNTEPCADRDEGSGASTAAAGEAGDAAIGHPLKVAISKGASEQMRWVPPLSSAGCVPPEWHGVCTVMMRNLPNRYSQLMLLLDIRGSGFRDTFDFMYLPIDPETNANKGYAFINFVEPAFAWQFKQVYENKPMKNFKSLKKVLVTPADLQGFEANYAKFFLGASRLNAAQASCRPLFFKDPSMVQIMGAMTAARVPFPDRRASAGGGAVPAPPLIANFCPSCGTKAEPPARFCHNCGTSLAD